MENEKGEKLVIAALSDNETNGLPHQELKAGTQEPEHVLMLEGFVGKLPKWKSWTEK